MKRTRFFALLAALLFCAALLSACTEQNPEESISPQTLPVPEQRPAESLAPENSGSETVPNLTQPVNPEPSSGSSTQEPEATKEAPAVTESNQSQVTPGDTEARNTEAPGGSVPENPTTSEPAAPQQPGETDEDMAVVIVNDDTDEDMP